MNLSELLKLGIIASLDGEGGLQLDAPKGALTPDLIERIRHHKPSLIAEIRAAREVGELGELHFLCTNPEGRELNFAGDVHRETPTDTAPPIWASRWLLHYADREPVEVYFAPAADHVEALVAYPDAVAAEPLPAASEGARESGQKSAHECTRESAQDSARQSLLKSARESIQKSARQTAQQSAQESAQQSAQESAPASCTSCRQLKRPGLSPGYCSDRDDMPRAYGTNHPLRRLPDDQGANCASYLPHED